MLQWTEPGADQNRHLIGRNLLSVIDGERAELGCGSTSTPATVYHDAVVGDHFDAIVFVRDVTSNSSDGECPRQPAETSEPYSKIL